MSVASLDRRITLLAPSNTLNVYDEPVTTYTDYCTVWASLRTIAAGEKLSASEIAAELTSRFTVRWSNKLATVDPRYKLCSRGVTYNILTVRRVGRRMWLELDAVTRADVS